MSIKLLEAGTIGKIAAGEVIERPASVVKELLENAIDAGASRIAIEIRGGGVDLIEVADDGCGMAADQLPLAIHRHATSKLSTFSDLDHLTTLGFRGEALPSIGAVADLRIRSRVRDAATGACVAVDFGEVAVVETQPTPPGTIVSVAQLFANVPARRKFLRQPATEASTIGRIVAAYAAAYPHIQFALEVEGKRSLGTDGTGSLISAAAGAFGVEVGNAALEITPLDEASAVAGVEVDGWVGAPNVHRSHRQQMVFFVNGRMIQNRALTFALEEAYHSLLMVGRHPVALVRIRVNASAVDINVHPTKAEVKFAAERSVFRAVQRGAHGALVKAPTDEVPRIGFQFPREASLQQRPLIPALRTEPAEGTGAQGRSVVAPTNGGRTVPVLRVLGQVSLTYIIAEGPDGLYLIDQHAAHERVMYEKIQACIKSASIDQQPFLDPLTVALPPEEYAVWERSQEELGEIGFVSEAFGEGTIVIRAIPAMMSEVDIQTRMHWILKELAEGGSGESWLDSVAISAACHTSIRAGQALSLPEMRELVSQLEQTRHPRACGHGRPTMLLMSQFDLEKQFARR